MLLRRLGMNRTLRYTIIFVLIILVGIGAIGTFNGNKLATNEIDYKEFITELDSGNVTEATIQPDKAVFVVTGKMKGYDDQEKFVVNLPTNNQELMNRLDKAVEDNTKIAYLPAPETGGWLQFLMGIIPFIVIIFLFFFLLSQSQGGGNRMSSFGKSKAKLYESDKKKVRFNDVAGAEEEKQELVEVVDFLKDHRKFTEMGARVPKGLLLVGPPGTGKTLFARAVAGEANVPFFSISGSDFIEMLVGVGASRVRDLFETAKKNSPCIIFIDEIDAVGGRRGVSIGGGGEERENTLNQLLVEMDGFGDNEGIIIIAATNRPDMLDPALLRPGRFDRQITIGRPDVKGREEVLKVHARNKPLADSVDLKSVAQRTPGFSGADLENLLNEAALVATRRNKKKIDMFDLDEATDRVIAGPAKTSRVISEKERNIVAFHEAGHVVVGLMLDQAEKVHKVTIVPRGQAGGYAVMLPKEDRYFMTKPELLDKIAGLLGGRVSEDIVFGEVSTGAHNDFERATAIARSMVTEYGMSDAIGPLQFKSSQGNFLGGGRSEQSYSESIAFEIDKEMQSIIVEQYERTRQILTENRELLDLIATTLLEVETLDAEQIESLRDTGKLPVRIAEPSVKPEEETTSVESSQVRIEKEGTPSVEAHVTNTKADPTTEDLQKEDVVGSDERTGFQEERK